METGGKIHLGKIFKPKKISKGLKATAGIATIGSAIAGSTVVGAPLAAPLGVIAGVSAGSAGLMDAFGGHISVRDMKILKGIKRRHDTHVSGGRQVSTKQVGKDISALRGITVKLEKKRRGGKIKPSSALNKLKHGAKAASTLSELTGVGIASKPVFDITATVAGGASDLLKAFGAGMSKTDINKVTGIHKRHMTAMGGGFKVSQKRASDDHRVLLRVHDKYIKKGGSLSVGGKVPKKYLAFMNKYPNHSVAIAKMVTDPKGGSLSPAKLGKVLGSAGLVLTGSALAGATALKIYLIKNPDKARNLALGIAGISALKGLTGGNLSNQSKRAFKVKRQFSLPDIGIVHTERVGRIIGGSILNHKNISKSARKFVSHNPASAIRMTHNIDKQIRSGKTLEKITQASASIGTKGLYGLGRDVMKSHHKLKDIATKVDKTTSEAWSSGFRSHLINNPKQIKKIMLNVRAHAVGSGLETGGGLKIGGGLSTDGGLSTGGGLSSGGRMVKVGNREQVWKGLAAQTSGGLTKNHLMISKTGKLVSKKKSAMGKQLVKEGKLKPFGSK